MRPGRNDERAPGLRAGAGSCGLESRAVAGCRPLQRSDRADPRPAALSGERRRRALPGAERTAGLRRRRPAARNARSRGADLVSARPHPARVRGDRAAAALPRRSRPRGTPRPGALARRRHDAARRLRLDDVPPSSPLGRVRQGRRQHHGKLLTRRQLHLPGDEDRGHHRRDRGSRGARHLVLQGR